EGGGFKGCGKVKGGAVDDLERGGGGGLLRRRPGQLMEGLCVLEGDEGWGGKFLPQLVLLGGEGAPSPPINCHHANRPVVLKHRHSDHSTDACDICPGNGEWVTTQVGRGSTQVANLDGLPSLCGADRWKIGIGTN